MYRFQLTIDVPDMAKYITTVSLQKFAKAVKHGGAELTKATLELLGSKMGPIDIQLKQE